MKKLFLAGLFLFSPLFLISEDINSTSAAVTAQNVKLKIAVPEFIYSNDPLNTTSVFYPAFMEELKKKGDFDIIEREDYEKLLKEKGLPDSKCRTTACMSKAAKTLLIDKIIMGMVTKTMDRYTVELNVFDKETNEVKSTEYFKIQSLRDLKTEAGNAAFKISAGIVVSKKGESKLDEMVRKVETRKIPEAKRADQVIKIGLGGQYGVSNLVNGYDSYVILNPFFCAQVHLRPYEQGKPSVLSFGFIFDEIPLSLPEGTYGQTEDVASLTGYLHFSPFPVLMLHPYIGVGLGAYFDYITVDTPASGYMSSMYFFMGFNISAGAEYRVNELLTVFAELKYHFVWEPGRGGMFLANHLTLGGGILLFLF